MTASPTPADAGAGMPGELFAENAQNSGLPSEAELQRALNAGFRDGDEFDNAAALQAIFSLIRPAFEAKEREIERLRATAISSEERLGDMIDASKEEWSKHGATEMALGQWKARATEAENGRDEWRRLFREERRSCAALEARALSAEAKLAQAVEDERERSITDYASHIDVALREYDDNLNYGDDAMGPEFFIERGMEAAASAIRARSAARGET